MDVRRLKSNELQHHGVKGQKWGIRKYQNKDGSLTTEGYLHYGYAVKDKITNPNNGKKETLYRITDKGIGLYIHKGKVTDEGKKYLNNKHSYIQEVKTIKNREAIIDDLSKKTTLKENDGKINPYIKKGVELERITNTVEPVDNHRKYMTLTEKDKQIYRENWDFFAKNTKDPLVETYVTNKDLKIATGEEAVNTVIKLLGNKKVNSITKYDKQTNKLSPELQKYYNNMKVKEALETIYDFPSIKPSGAKIEKDMQKQIVAKSIHAGKTYGRAIIYQSLFKNNTTQSKIIKDLEKRGYNAMVDIEDAGGFSSFPLIIFSPKENVTKKKTEHLFNNKE